MELLASRASMHSNKQGDGKSVRVSNEKALSCRRSIEQTEIVRDRLDAGSKFIVLHSAAGRAGLPELRPIIQRRHATARAHDAEHAMCARGESISAPPNLPACSCWKLLDAARRMRGSAEEKKKLAGDSREAIGEPMRLAACQRRGSPATASPTTKARRRRRQ